MAEPRKMDIEAIMHLLPHRYPFLLVDRVLDVQSGQYVRAIKNVTFNEPFFTGHFPHRPVMPGVMIIEALAQTCGILAFHTVEVVPDSDTRFYFVAIDNARFRRPVEPGDQILLKAQLKRSLKGIWKFDCQAEVDGAVVASAEIMVAPETKAPAVKAPAVQAPAVQAPAVHAPAVQAPAAKAQKPEGDDKARDDPEGTGAVG